MRNIKVLIIDSGLHQQEAFGTSHDTFRYSYRSICALKKSILFFYDIVIIPFHIDQFKLSKLKSAFELYFKKSGVILFLGTTDINGYDWIPKCRWNTEYPVNCKISENVPTLDKKIFNELNDDDLKYHTGYAAHGNLVLSNVDTCQVLIESTDGKTVMFYTGEKSKGTILITTIDPDYHCCRSTPGPSLEQTYNSQIKAKRLLDNLLLWAGERAENNSKIQLRLLGFSLRIFYWLRKFLLLFIPAIFGYWIYTLEDLPKAKSIMVIIAASAAVASILNYYQNFQNKRDN